LRNQLKITFLDKLCYVIAIGFGAGLSPIVPGTCGSMVGLIFAVFRPNLALIFALFLIGIWICSRAEAKFFNSTDPAPIVFDEIVGMLVSLIFIPVTWPNLALGFILFRLFDITKPWPIGLIDRKCKAGLGIMLDDIIAGVYANCSLQLIILWLNK
jgi:phosphatidylglycerophosphatase A